MALTAATLSLTVGALVGAVITIGAHARSRDPLAHSTVAGSTVVSPSITLSDGPDQSSGLLSEPLSTDPDTPSTSLPRISPSMTPSVTVLAAASSLARPVPTAPSPQHPATPPRPTPHPSTPPGIPTATRTATSTPVAVIYTTVLVTPAAPPSSTQPTTTQPTSTQPTSTQPTSTAPTTAQPTTTAPTSTAPAGTPVAGGPCGPLGLKSSVAGGSTVFCQRNFATGGLAWRPVVDGGGCLSNRMTGIGLDGRSYVCRPDRHGFDHWRAA